MALCDRGPDTAPGCPTGVGARAFLLPVYADLRGLGPQSWRAEATQGPCFLTASAVKLVLRCCTIQSLQNRQPHNYCQMEELRCHKYKILCFT